MTAYEIPLSSKPQQFQIQLSGVTYLLKIVWNTAVELWLLDLYTNDLQPLITSLPVQPGADMLNQFEHLGIGGQLWAQLDGSPTAAPGFDNLGTSGHLYFVTP